MDYSLVDKLVEVFSKNNFDYVTNTLPPTYPDGLDQVVKLIQLRSKLLVLRQEKINLHFVDITEGVFGI